MNDSTAANPQAECACFTLEDWAGSRPADFNLQAEFDARVEPLMKALIEECVALGIPTLVVAAYGQDSVGVRYAMQSHFPGLGKTPPGLLCAIHAAKGELDGIDAVLHANELRVVMTAITQH